jgi:AcrR family transcriptional regulator
MTGRSQGSGASRRAILEAAIEEFAAKGFNGARMEAVARRAGYNKALVYRYFEDKRRLFHEAFRFKHQLRVQLARKLPADMAERFHTWFRETLRDPQILRLLMHEALESDGGEPIDAEFRRKIYGEQVDFVRLNQAQGRIDKRYDPAYTLLAFAAMAYFPAALPQVTQMITGSAVDSKKFKREWKKFLTQFVDSFQPAPFK